MKTNEIFLILETDAKFNTEVLMVYYFTGDVVQMHQEIMKVIILLKVNCLITG